MANLVKSYLNKLFMPKQFSKHLLIAQLFVALACLFISPNCVLAQSGFSNIGSFLDTDIPAKDIEPKEAKIKEVLVEGNRLIPEDHILSVIESKAGTVFDRGKILRDLEAIDSLGFFIHDSIQASPVQTTEGVLIKIRIEEHSPITGVQIIGNKTVSTEELLVALKELIGKPESINKTSEALDLIEKKYQERGFVLARVSDISIDPDGILTVKIDEGKIGNITISGNDKTKEKYIKRLMPNIVPGESYNELLLVQDLRALQSTGFFEDIKRSIVPSNEHGTYDLIVEVKEKRTASFGFGGGVNTVNGAFANVGFNNNNLFGEGNKIALNTQFGTGILANTIVNQRFLSDKKSFQVEARYTDPNFRGTDNSLSLFAQGYSFNSYLVDLAQERNLSVGASFTKPLGKNVFGSLDLIGETVEMKDFGFSATNFLTEQLLESANSQYLGDVVDKNAFKPGESIYDHDKSVKKDAASELAKEIRKEQLHGGNFIHLAPALTFDTRDKNVSPESGWYNMVSLGQAVGIGNDSFTKLGIDIRRYVPVGKKTTLAFNLQGASSIIGDIPMYNQFKAGGYYGVRGYRSFSDLGIGSRSLFASAELRTPFLDVFPAIKNNSFFDNLRLVFFGDFGYAGGNNRINALYNRLNIASSAGLGLRANIPMLGPIRIDYGMPLIKPLWNNNSLLGKFNFGFADRF